MRLMALLNRIKNIFGRNSRNTEDTQVRASQVISQGPSSDTTLLGARSRMIANREIPFQATLPYLFAALLGFLAADFTALYSRQFMIPNSTVPMRRMNMNPDMPVTAIRQDYDNIVSRNIFNSDGVIPENMLAKEDGAANKPLDENIAVETGLPLTLLGTIVHVNPGKSVATLEVKGQSAGALPYVPNDDIEGLATLIKVERKKAFIKNLSTNRYEFVQIKDDPSLSLKKAGPAKPSGGGGAGPVKKEGENTFALQRSNLEGLMNNLPDLLTQARAIPNIGPGGKPDGFKIVEIQPGSIYEQLGIQMNDTIKGVDGEPVDSAAKAMELYNALRTRSNVSINIERGGKPVTLNYNIR